LLIEVANWKVVGLLAGMSIALAAAACRRRQWVALTAAAIVFGTAAGADAVNAYYGYLPQLADVAGVTDWQVIPARDVLTAASVSPDTLPVGVRRDGGVVALPVTGRRSGFGRHDVLVYLPPAYFTAPQLRFPVVYLLHGSPGRPQDWLRAGRLPHLVDSGQAGQFIFVMPPMSRGWLDDSECVNGRREQVDTWLVEDVVPRMDEILRTVADRSHRALAGMSATTCGCRGYATGCAGSRAGSRPPRFARPARRSRARFAATATPRSSTLARLPIVGAPGYGSFSVGDGPRVRGRR
jgi:hypothetical protein